MKLSITDFLMYVDILLGLVYYYMTHNRPLTVRKTVDKAFMWLNGFMLLVVFLLVLMTGRKGDFAAVYRILPWIFLAVEAVVYIRYLYAAVSQHSAGTRIGDGTNSPGSGLHVGGRRPGRK